MSNKLQISGKTTLVPLLNPPRVPEIPVAREHARQVLSGDDQSLARVGGASVGMVHDYYTLKFSAAALGVGVLLGVLFASDESTNKMAWVSLGLVWGGIGGSLLVYYFFRKRWELYLGKYVGVVGWIVKRVRAYWARGKSGGVK